MQVESFYNWNNGDKVRSSVCGKVKMRALHWLIYKQNILIGKWIKAWVVLAAQKDKIVDLWRRKRCCGRARNAFIPHYVAAIQYSAPDPRKNSLVCRPG